MAVKIFNKDIIDAYSLGTPLTKIVSYGNTVWERQAAHISDTYLVITTTLPNESKTLYFDNGIVDWGDGTIDSLGMHTYQLAGTYTIYIKCDYFNLYSSRIGMIDEFVLGTDVSIGTGYFNSAGTKVKKLKILDGVTAVVPEVLTDVLEEITIPDTLEIFSHYGEYYSLDVTFRLFNSGLTNTYTENGLTYIGNETNPYVILIGSDTTISGEEVTLPEGCKIIWRNAFVRQYSGLGQITKLDAPGVTLLMTGGLHAQHNLSEINLPSIKYIHTKAFEDAYSIHDLKISVGNDIQLLHPSAFPNPILQHIDASILNDYEGCYYLGNEDNSYSILVNSNPETYQPLIIHPDCKVINQYAFSGALISGVINLPEGVIQVGDYAFYEVGATDFTLPSTLRFIGNWAISGFYDEPEQPIERYINAEYIGSYGFANMSQRMMSKVVLGDKVRVVSNYGFAVGSNEFVFNDDVMFIGESAVLAYNLLTLPNGSPHLAKYPFYGCMVPTLHIPEHFYATGSTSLNAFGCYPLQSVTVGNTNWLVRDGILYYHITPIASLLSFSGTTINFYGDVPDLFFSGNQNLTDLTVTGAGAPTYTRKVGDYAFSNTSLASITLPDTIQEIRGSAFAGTNLTEFTIPRDCYTITLNAFYQTPLTSMNIHPDNQYFLKVGNDVFGSKFMWIHPDTTEVIVPSNWTGGDLNGVMSYNVETIDFTNCPNINYLYNAFSYGGDSKTLKINAESGYMSGLFIGTHTNSSLYIYGDTMKNDMDWWFITDGFTYDNGNRIYVDAAVLDDYRTMIAEMYPDVNPEIFQVESSMPNYFCIENLYNGNNSVVIAKKGTPAVTSFEWSKDGETWNTGLSVTVTLAAGEKLYLRGNQGVWSTGSNNRVTIRTKQNAKVSGNILTLLNYETPPTSLPNYCFLSLFDASAFTTFDTTYLGISDASELILPNFVSENCYANMFYKANNLLVAPALPATTLADNCYEYMFNSCSSLVEAPILPAPSLALSCYFRMFENCSNLNHVKIYAEGTVSNSYALYWLRNVAATGTIECPVGCTFIDSASIPTGWTKVEF